MHAQLKNRYSPEKTRLALVLGCVLAFPACAVGAQAPANADSGDLRFAVAHQHMASWCYGYLYVTADQLRYEVVQPQSDRGHSFAVDRAKVIAGHRLLFGQPAEALKDFINVKIKGQSYNFLWLDNEAEVKTGGSHRMSPPQAAPPDTLLAALQNPPAGSPAQDATSQPAAPAAAAQQQTQTPPAQELVPEGDVRFAVAHHHKDASWCYGYLYVTRDQVRYKVVQPEANRQHAFALDRSSVTARRWLTKANAPAERIQSAQDAFELASQGVIYHFRWLANEDDVNSGSARPANPPQAAPPDMVIRKIQTSRAMPPGSVPWTATALPARSELAAKAVTNAIDAMEDGKPALWR
jgi:hypothetical protein